MPFRFKRWWKGIAIATLAFQLLCLVISPNPLSIMLIPVGTAVFGGSAPLVLFGFQDFLNTSKTALGRSLGLAQTLFCAGFAWFGIQAVWAAIVVSLALLGWKLD
jgi:hypothetical protein